MYGCRDRLMEPPNTLPKTSKPRAARAQARSSTAARIHLRHRKGCRPRKTKSSGATTRSPTMSPIHHARSAGTVALEETVPARRRLVTPIDALSAVLQIAGPTISPTTSSTRSSCVWKRTRPSDHTPAIASSVLPKAIPSAAGSGAPATRLTQRAPANTPGQRRKPKSHRAASAMPVGGQTSVAKPATASRRSPSRAVTKYAAKRRTQPRDTSVRLFSSLMAADHDQLERDVQWEGGFPTRPGREAPRRASREVLWWHHGRDDVVS